MAEVSELKELVSIEMLARRHNIGITNFNGSGRCPQCGGHKSLRVWNNSIFKCYRCDYKGDIFSLLTRGGIAKDFKEAIYLVRDIIGDTNSQAEYNYRGSTLQQVFSIYKQTADNHRDIVENYFDSRGWDLDMLNKHEVGLSIKTTTLTDGGITPAQLDECELLINSREYYDNHLIFPVYNQSGRLIHLNGRALDNRKGRWISTSYSNGGNISRYFYNSKVLYKKEDDQADTLFLCEGVSDCFSLMHLTDNAIAQFGINVQQAPHHESFSKFDQIVAIFDNDKYAEGHPRAGEYKSWSQVVPNLVDLISFTKKPIYYLTVPNTCGIKDLNDWLISIDYDVDLFTEYVQKNAKPLTYLCMELYKDNIREHDYIHTCAANLPTSRKKWFRYLSSTYGSLEDYLIKKYQEV